MYEECKKKGILISDSLADFNFGRSNIRLPHSTPDQMEQLRYETTLKVNFVENYDLRHGAAKQALIGFKDAAERVPDQAFAHYFSSKAYEQLGNPEEQAKSLTRYYEIVNASKLWAAYAQKFGLPLQNKKSEDLDKVKLKGDGRFLVDGAVN